MDKKELIFNIHKNDIIEDNFKFKKMLYDKYGLNYSEIHDMFTNIVNYQIDTYGSQLIKYKEDTSIDTYYHKNRNSVQRKYERTKSR